MGNKDSGDDSPPAFQREIAARLVCTRERLKLGSMSDMARSIGLEPGRYWNYETARRALDAEIAAKIVEVHAVDFNWLFGGDVSSLTPSIRRKLVGKDEVAEAEARTRSLVRKQSKRKQARR